MSKVLLYLCLLSLTVDSYYCFFTDINQKLLSQSLMGDRGNSSYDEVDNDLAAIAYNQVNIIYPGTKWCGTGNTASNYNDLGSEKETDKCCRDHDNCPDVIAGGQTGHNLKNSAFYTRLSCDCDNKFYNCLKAVKTTTSKTIGGIYFNTLQTECFREDYPATCAKKGGFLNTKCTEYSYDKNGKKSYQWFSEKDF